MSYCDGCYLDRNSCADIPCATNDTPFAPEGTKNFIWRKVDDNNTEEGN